MKIAIYNGTIDYGGVSSVFLKLHKNIIASGIESDLICFYNTREKSEAKILVGQGLISEIISLIKYINKKHTEVIILTPCIHILGIKIYSFIRRRDIKVITTIHMRPKFWLLNKSFNNKITNLLTRISVRLSDQVISVSNDLAKELINKKLVKPNKLITIYNPIVEQEVKQHSTVNIKEKDIINLVTIGWIYELKGQHTVIEALHKLNSPRFRVNIIGGIKDEEYYKMLLKMIEDYKLDAQVRFIGTVDNVKDYLKSMDVYILASHSEALPTVLIEALEAGIPIIASNCKWGPKEVLDNGEYGILYNTGDSNQLAYEVQRLTDSNSIYNQFREKSYKQANKFLEEIIIRQYFKLINN